ncbi:Single-stranded-DNA-specific exonuclease RecJ [Lysobacter dokdonensis DS-58]|uniref:Single-stranded-DNA-specific exonuclease RecJ n=1 Tax=Lysobacter dokdonensis DS-58 TaxID=1300345 RepID=A0A0A2WPL4_9GAMM|nr:single-stranded-DNA-specific exonuclease RecJ [Lysobacter dokdonensis]KGQ20210.1 Single-stranded-DNA-specific exonuclease RecJ [Lysobacter dokdonensis DS-58]
MTLMRRIVRRPVVVPSGEWPDQVPMLLRRLYATRGAADFETARPKLARLHAPDTMGGMDAATALLRDAIVQDKHIVVVGDFDCDGATACAVGVRGLRMLGAKRVSHAVPNRAVHGYGLSPGLIDDLAALQPELLVTVDHGIACHAGVAAARARGWQVLVTDHHLPGQTLPDANAIVDPNVRGDGFPSKALAGVGVMFYVLLALRARLRAEGLPGDADLTTLLDLVAVGTIADLVPLDANNRALAGAGLRRLRAGQGCAGLQALIEGSGRDVRTLTAADIGYGLAPRINAAGRLEDMALGIECLLSDDLAHARHLAGVLGEINAERKGVQQQMTDEAEAALARVALDGDMPPVLCLFDPAWHPGVVGLVASRMKDRVHRPVVAFAPAEPGSEALRGSARSIPGLHIRDALAAVDTALPGMIPRFGGHAMAAGLSLSHGALDAFANALRVHVEGVLDPALLQAEVVSDGALEAHEFDRASAECLRDGGPWGQAFPEPLFDGVFDVVGHRVVGMRHLKLSLRLPGRPAPLDAIHFNGWTGHPPPPRVHLAYRLAVDDYRGGDAIQLIVEYSADA